LRDLLNLSLTDATDQDVFADEIRPMAGEPAADEQGQFRRVCVTNNRVSKTGHTFQPLYLQAIGMIPG
jgi:hypothetical protein